MTLCPPWMGLVLCQPGLQVLEVEEIPLQVVAEQSVPLGDAGSDNYFKHVLSNRLTSC